MEETSANSWIDEPLILSAAKDTISRFRVRYECSRGFHTPCVHNHKKIIDQLEVTSKLYKEAFSQFENLKTLERQVDLECCEMKKTLMQHSKLIWEHVQVQKRINTQVKKLKTEIEEISNLTDLEKRVSEINSLNDYKTKLMSKLDESKKCERFLLLCADRHFNVMGEKQMDALVEKYNSLKESDVEWSKSCWRNNELSKQHRMACEEEKRKLQVDILDSHQRSSMIPDRDQEKNKLVDTRAKILNYKLQVNTKETQLFALKIAADNLFSYISGMREIKPHNRYLYQEHEQKQRNSLEKLDSVLIYIKDMRDILNEVARLDEDPLQTDKSS